MHYGLVFNMGSYLDKLRIVKVYWHHKYHKGWSDAGNTGPNSEP